MTISLVFWKHHVAIDFTERGIPTFPNGVGKGGHCYTSVNYYLTIHADDVDKFYLAPVLLEESDYTFHTRNNNIVRVIRDNRPVLLPFAPARNWSLFQTMQQEQFLHLAQVLRACGGIVE